MPNKTCLNCACNRVCNHNLFGFENCGNWIPSDASKGEYIHLPCKAGDYVYEPRPDRGVVSVYKITAVKIRKTGLFFYWGLIDGIYSHTKGFEDSELGKTVFLTREAAEQALKERDNNVK